MIVAKKWAAAGSTATLLAGGLFLGAPAATAAPGDAVCLDASVQFNAALGAAGIDLAFVSQLEVAVANVVATTENLLTVSVALNIDELLESSANTERAAAEAQLNTEAAKLAVADAIAVSTVVDEAGNPAPELDPVVIEARAAEEVLSGEETLAVEAAVDAALAYNNALADPALIAAQADFEAVTVEADALVAQLGGDEVLAAQIVELFKAFLAACDASAIGVDPVTPIAVPVAPVGPGVTPVGPAPVAPEVVVTPVAPGVAAPTGTNKGLNVQTAVATEDNSAAVTLIAALLAVGVAVPVATAARMRRLERAQR